MTDRKWQTERYVQYYVICFWPWVFAKVDFKKRSSIALYCIVRLIADLLEDDWFRDRCCILCSRSNVNRPIYVYCFKQTWIRVNPTKSVTIRTQPTKAIGLFYSTQSIVLHYNFLHPNSSAPTHPTLYQYGYFWPSPCVDPTQFMGGPNLLVD